MIIKEIQNDKRENINQVMLYALDDNIVVITLENIKKIFKKIKAKASQKDIICRKLSIFDAICFGFFIIF